MAAHGCRHLRLNAAAIKSLPSAMAARGSGRRGRRRRYARRPSPSSSTSPRRTSSCSRPPLPPRASGHPQGPPHPRQLPPSGARPVRAHPQRHGPQLGCEIKFSG
ncbi:Os02g0478450 [Oryza sativa Japonica Group]|uniref:Os02g0478450 protein n=1 Tax=Oryza sativa subsp. japonica TaxID=39947 RepID=A0A0P0VJ14_ORYSJ|nr:Os02g0478450 [Oryza sativa Japonica Group]